MGSRFNKDLDAQFREDVMEELKKLREEIVALKNSMFAKSVKSVEKTELKKEKE